MKTCNTLMAVGMAAALAAFSLPVFAQAGTGQTRGQQSTPAQTQGAAETPHTVRVVLSGDQEVPPVKTTASGSGTITVNPDKTISGTVATTGVEGSMAHIHEGPAGKVGPPIITLQKNGQYGWSVPAGAKLTDQQYSAFRNGNLYVNVHSAAHKDGEVRGQLMP